MDNELTRNHKTT